MRAIAFIAMLSLSAPSFVLAQQPTISASPSPSPDPSPAAGTVTLPKGWERLQGDTPAIVVFLSDLAPQRIYIAAVPHESSFTVDAGVQKMREVFKRVPFPESDVRKINLCNGSEPAVLSTGKNAKGQTIMEQLLIMGRTGGAVITYEILDGRPDPQAEAAIRSVCIP
ncbi:MAG: hypothetical protein JO165_06190 [Candidatus Eremiobacteraeota bacterium]|nr:hypothetical protein [Candidatus Eremiobacteraeota bacterium]